jgi:hypothetical protein
MVWGLVKHRNNLTFTLYVVNKNQKHSDSLKLIAFSLTFGKSCSSPIWDSVAQF